MLLNICHHCDKIIDRGDTIYMGYDKNFCSTICRSVMINQQGSIQRSTSPIKRHKSHAVITINQSSSQILNEISNSTIKETTIIKKDLDISKITRLKSLFNKIKNCLCFIICVVSIYHINLYSMNYIV